MSRADLAHRVRNISGGAIKASERSVRGWEKGEYVPSGETVPALAKAVGCAVPELFGDDLEEEAASMADRDLLSALAVALEPFHPRAQREKVA